MEFFHGCVCGFSRNNFDLANNVAIFVEDFTVFVGEFAGAFRGIRVFGQLTNDLPLLVKNLALLIDLLALKNGEVRCESRSNLSNLGSIVNVGNVLRDLLANFVRDLFTSFLSSCIQFVGGISCHDLSSADDITIFVDNLAIFVQSHTDKVLWITFGDFA